MLALISSSPFHRLSLRSLLSHQSSLLSFHHPARAHFPTSRLEIPARRDSRRLYPRSILADTKHPSCMYSGIPFAHGNNPLLVPILHAPTESFASDTDSDAGADALFDAAEQRRRGSLGRSGARHRHWFSTRDNSARVTWVGGVELFSDEYANKIASFVRKRYPLVAPSNLIPHFSGEKSGNEQFARDLVTWTFQENHVLRIDSITHHLTNETVPREHYTINETLCAIPLLLNWGMYFLIQPQVFEAHISRYDSGRGWLPYSGLHDLPIEFTMLDPPHPHRASPGPRKARPATRPHSASPTRHGVFKFVLDYRRRGWTTLKATMTVPVVPPRHDGYPRFLSAAWPYYAGSIST